MATFSFFTHLSSQLTVYYIGTKKTPHLNGKHVVFGLVVEGMDVVKTVENVGSRSGATKSPVTIAASGQL